MENNRNDIQMRFTAYLKKSLKNARGNYLLKKIRITGTEIPVDEYEEFADYGTNDILFEMESATNKVFDGIMEMRLLWDQIADDRLLQALTKLSAIQKNIILLRIFYEKSFEEIGKTLDIPGKKAENTYYNAIKKIRKLLGGNGDVF